MMKFLKYLWQLPQNLVGIIYGYFYILEWIYSKEDFDLYVHYNKGCITLGRYVFISSRAGLDEVDLEMENVRWSKKLGPLYLFVITIPQIIKGLFTRKC